MLALLLAVAIPAVPTAPPPIIITTKTSVLCNAVRTIVAPALAGMIAQDLMIDRGRGLVQDMAAMHAGAANTWVELDTMRLGNVVDGIAANDTKVHRLLDKMADVQLRDRSEAVELSALHSRLLDIADQQAESLNVLSGTADTEALNELQAFRNAMAAMLQPDTLNRAGQAAAQETQSPPPLDASPDLAAKQSTTGREESPILALVRPIVERCR